MRRAITVLVAATVCLLASSAARAETIALTGGSINLYLGDPGSAFLTGDGFAVGSTAGGGWPFSFRPGDLVDYSTTVGLSDWGPAVVNGVPLRGNTDPHSPATGRLWISGSLRVTAVPFVAPPPTVNNAYVDLSTPVTLTGTIAGYFDCCSPTQPPMFTVNVTGQGVAKGPYYVSEDNNGPVYKDFCCSVIDITAAAPSPTPEPGTLLMIATGLVAAYRRTRTSSLGD
jgi:hypothetical protein